MRIRTNRPVHSDLDSPGCLAAAQIPAPSLTVWLVFVKPGDDAAPESLYLSGFDDLVDPFGQAPLPPVIQLRLPGFGQPVAGIKAKREPGCGKLILPTVIPRSDNARRTV